MKTRRKECSSENGKWKFEGSVEIENKLKVEGNAKFKKNLSVDGNETVKESLSVLGGLRVTGGEVVDTLIVLNNATINGTLTVANETVDNLTVNKSLIIPRVDINTTSPVGKQGDLVYDTSVPGPNDNALHLSDGTQWLTIPANPVGGVYTINADGSGDFATIQDGIDYVSSGLKPVPNPVTGDSNIIFQISPGVYRGSLFIDNNFSTPTLNDPGSDLVNTPGRGVKIFGDLRPIANMVYMNGGQVRSPPAYTTLGHQGGIVTLANVGNTITVTNTGGPNPDFVASGVVSGDIIVVTDSNGVDQQRTVDTVSGNSINYLGTFVTVTGAGASLMFMPNVQVMSSIPDYTMILVNGEIEIRGIWFINDPTFAATSIYTVVLLGGTLYYTNIVVDGRNNSTVPSLSVSDGAQINSNLADYVIQGSLSVLGGFVFIQTPALVAMAYVYVVMTAAAVAASPACFYILVNFNNRVDFIQVNGAGGVIGVNIEPESSCDTELLVAFNCTIGLAVRRFSSMDVGGQTLVENCSTGINIIGGNLTQAGDFGAGSNCSMINCAVGMLNNIGGTFISNFPTIFNNCPLGIKLTNSSKFVTASTVTYTTVANPRVVDTFSRYEAPSDPLTPKGVLIVNASGPVDGSVLIQRLDTGAPLAMTLSPGQVISAVTIYEGKTYQIYNVGLPKQNTIATTGEFIGVVSALSMTIAKFNGTALGEGLTFTVMSGTDIQVISSTGVTFLP